MNRLKGKSILVGRNSGVDNLSVAVVGTPYKSEIGQPHSVPRSVSRCQPERNTAHCRIDIDALGRLTITNLKDNNMTYVGGVPVLSMHVEPNNMVEMGLDHFSIPIGAILNNIVQVIPQGGAMPQGGMGGHMGTSAPQQPQSVSIRHLERVWNDYENAQEELARRLNNRNRKRMLPIMLSMASGVVSLVLIKCVFQDLTDIQQVIVQVAAMLLPLTLYLKNFFEKDTTFRDKKNLNEWFMDNYVCPNPSCRRFMGNQPYKLLRQNTQCPYCRSKFLS